MSEIVRFENDGRLSRAVVYNGLVFLSGVTADDRGEDIRGQMSQVLEKVDRLLASAGTDKSRCLSVQVWLKDIARDFSGMNEVWRAWVAPDASPARATAQAEMALPEIFVEIVVIAAVAA